MTLTKSTLVMALTLTTALGAFSGCAGTGSRAEVKQAARDRWTGARTNITYSLAQQQFEVGDLDKAEKTIAEAISVRPDDPRFYDLAARISMERGELERAYRQVEHSLKLDDERHEPHYLAGVLQQRWQRYDEALEYYEQAFAYRPAEPAALLAVAEMLVKLDRTDEAVERLEERLAYFANNAAIRTSLGRIYMMRHEYQRAVAMFREASVLSPDDQGIKEHLAMAEFAHGEYGNTIRVLSSLLAMEKNQDREDLKVILGDAFMATEQPVQARRVFLELTQKDPNDVNAWIKLAQAAWMVGDESRLKQATDRVVSLAPRRHEGYMLRGMMAHREGDSGMAVAHFDRAAQLAPSNAQPWILMGIAKEQAGDAEGAAEAYREALAIEPEDARARQLLAGVSP